MDPELNKRIGYYRKLRNEIQSKDAEISKLQKENEIMVKAIDAYAAIPHHLSGIAIKAIADIHAFRATLETP